MADRIRINFNQQKRRADLSEEQKRDLNEKTRIRTANGRNLKKKENGNDNEPSASLRPDESVLEPEAACTPSLSDDAVETPEPCTSSSSSHLKRRKIVDEDDIIVGDEIAQESKNYDFFQYIPQSDSSSHVTEQQVLIRSSRITQNTQPPTVVRNVKY